MARSADDPHLASSEAFCGVLPPRSGGDEARPLQHMPAPQLAQQQDASLPPSEPAPGAVSCDSNMTRKDKLQKDLKQWLLTGMRSAPGDLSDAFLTKDEGSDTALTLIKPCTEQPRALQDHVSSSSRSCNNISAHAEPPHALLHPAPESAGVSSARLSAALDSSDALAHLVVEHEHAHAPDGASAVPFATSGAPRTQRLRSFQYADHGKAPPPGRTSGDTPHLSASQDCLLRLADLTINGKRGLWRNMSCSTSTCSTQHDPAHSLRRQSYETVGRQNSAPFSNRTSRESARVAGGASLHGVQREDPSRCSGGGHGKAATKAPATNVPIVLSREGGTRSQHDTSVDTLATVFERNCMQNAASTPGVFVANEPMSLSEPIPTTCISTAAALLQHAPVRVPSSRSTLTGLTGASSRHSRMESAPGGMTTMGTQSSSTHHISSLQLASSGAGTDSERHRWSSAALSTPVLQPCSAELRSASASADAVVLDWGGLSSGGLDRGVSAGSSSQAHIRPTVREWSFRIETGSDQDCSLLEPCGDVRGLSPTASGTGGAHKCNGSTALAVDGAAEESFVADLDLRLARSRQTLSFATNKLRQYWARPAIPLSLWDALSLLDSVPRVPSDARSGSLVDSAYACAALCIDAFPGQPAMVLAGLLHGLGRIISLDSFGGEPTWCAAGEAYPLGCAFSRLITAHNYVTSCPDRRRAALQTELGLYTPACGWDQLKFTWTGSEYLVQVLKRVGANLPAEAMYVLRYCHFEAGLAGGYDALMSTQDRRLLPTLRRFAELLARVRSDAVPTSAIRSRAEVRAMCEAAASRYLPSVKLGW